MKTALIMVGLPASGKSTFIQNLLDKYSNLDGIFVYSTDSVLEEIARNLSKTYDEVFEQHINSAKMQADEHLTDAIAQGHDIIWDQTNIGAKKRKGIANRLKSNGYDVKCVCFLPPRNDEEESELHRRLGSRPGKTIPDHVVNSMMKSFTVPEKQEGFDAIIVRDIYGKAVA